MVARLLFSLLFCLALPALAQVPKLEVSVKRESVDGEHEFEVSASGTVQANQAVVWKILTAYERMPEFVPDMQSAKVLARNGNRVLLEQYGQAHFLFFTRHIHLIVNVSEEPMSRIDIVLVDGDMKVYHCRWELSTLPDNGGTRIVYTGTMVPRFYVPGILGTNFVRADIERMMAAVLARIDQPG